MRLFLFRDRYDIIPKGDSMRLKNVKGASEIISSSSYVISDPSLHRGNFKQLFENQNPIKIEIGMGKGNFIIENALRYPNINFIGIEKFDSVIVRAIQKLEDQVIPNLKLIRMDALKIDEVFDKEIDTIYLNFSDPWPKKRHWNRRLTSPIFLKKYETIFQNHKHIVMKTDNQDLFEYSIMSFNHDGYHFTDLSLDLYKNEELIKNNIPTEYESRFVGKGMSIYFIDVEKK